MIELTRIVCPVDFSDASRDALRHAAALAHWTHARLTVLHACHVDVPTVALAPGMGAIGSAAVIVPPVDFDLMTRDLEQFAATAGVAGSGIDYRVIGGAPAPAIAEAAAAEHADLIVVGTHGRTRLARIVLGSVTERLLSIAPCSMLIVPPGSPTPVAPLMFSRILVATDFSLSSERAMALAVSLGRDADARVTALHVVELPAQTGEWAIDGIDMGALTREAVASSRRRLTDAVPAAARDWCDVTERVETGGAYQQILRVAAEDDARLIVLGVHGHGAIERFFLGSTAQHVVRQAHCPVLAVRV
jgi:nucleotide-binding universal stress UspA family protein